LKVSHVALAVVVAAVWGFNFVVIAVGLESFPPLLLSALRFTLAAFPAVLFIGMPQVKWRWILGIGIALGVVSFNFLFIGINVGMPPGLASLVLQSQAFFTVLLAMAFFGDRPRLRQSAGMALAIGGMVVIASDLEVSGSLGGFILVVAAAAAWGVSNIFTKQAAAPDALRLMVWVSAVPPIPLFIMSWLFEGEAAMADITLVGVGSVVYLALVSTLLGFGIWGFLLRTYSASVVAPFSLLVPIFGMSTSALFLGESFGPLRLLGAALVVAGLFFIVYQKRDPMKAPAV
jgi:O-acetylserine/cysteine efflux transporter